jgi:hypothetical protein
LDKNGKRGECGGTSDEEENDEEVDKRVAKKLKTILNTLDLTSSLASKKHKVNRVLQQTMWEMIATVILMLKKVIQIYFRII